MNKERELELIARVKEEQSKRDELHQMRNDLELQHDYTSRQLSEVARQHEQQKAKVLDAMYELYQLRNEGK